MKTKTLSTVAAVIFSISAAQAEKVQFENLPRPLQDAIRAQAGSAPIEDIDMQMKDGAAVYEVAFKRNGQHTEMRFGPDGKLVDQAGAPALDSRKVSFNEMPAAAQQVVRSRSGRAQIEDVDRVVKDGNVSYEVSFKQRGQQQELLVSHDGRILRDVATAAVAPTPAPVAVGGPPAAASGSGSSGQVNLQSKPVEITAGRKIHYNEAPLEVQKALTASSAGIPIEVLEVGMWNGQMVYEGGFKHQGKFIEVQFDHHGKTIYDPRLNAAGAPPAAASGSGASAQVNLQPKPVEISGGRKIHYNEAPLAVQKALTASSGGIPIEDLELGVWNGQTVYEGGFKHNGKHIEVQFSDDGRTIHDPRLAAAPAGAPAASVTGRGASSKYPNIIQPVSVSGGHKIELKEAPLRVQSTLRDQLGSAIVEDLELGNWQGRTVYQAGFKHNGQHVELQLDEDGNIIYDPRTQLNK